MKLKKLIFQPNNMGSSGGGPPSKQIFDQALVVLTHLQAKHEERRQNTQLQSVIVAVRATVDFFVQDFNRKIYHEYDSTTWANSLKEQVDNFVKNYPDKASALDTVLKEKGQKLLTAVSKELGN